MSNTSCASQYDIDRFKSLNFLVSNTVDIAVMIISFAATIVVVPIILKKTIFELSTKILLLQSVIYAFLFQCCNGIEVISLLYKGFFKLDEPCELLQSEPHCLLHFEFYIFTTSGMIYGQTGLMLERACATFIKNYPKEARWTVSWIIFIVVFLMSGFSGPLLVLDDPLNGYVFACYVIPKHSVPRATRFYMILTVLTLLNLVASVYIMRHNKRFEYETRFKVGARFQKRQAIESTATICFLALSLFVFLLIYSMGISILLNIRTMIPPAYFGFFITWCFTPPFVAMMIPVLIILRVRTTRANRVQTISGITQENQTQDYHIQQIRAMWS